MDYRNLFKDKVIIITGAGRSGTTILGKIIGSMEPCYYLFEPSIMKFGGYDFKNLRATIFEDYWILQIQGRNWNWNEHDDSYWRNYLDGYIDTDRFRAIEETRNSKLCIKVTECQQRIGFYDILFPELKAIHIYRDGNDVVDSMVKRGWYSDKYMRMGYLDHLQNGYPWFLTHISGKKWNEYNQYTRCAAVWRSTTETGVDSDMVQIRYENLAGYNFDALASDLGLKISKLTRKHIGSIRKPSKHPDITGSIQEPEKSRFMALMNRLEYI